MKSKMVNCYDYRQVKVEEGSGRWRIPDGEIETELTALAKDYSGEEEVSGAVEAGDSVRLICTGASRDNWMGRSVLLYPGRGIPGAEEAEQKVLGKSAGDEFECRLKDMNVTFKVERAVRMHIMTISDELAAALKLPEVETVEDYYKWYRKQHEAERKERACIVISRTWLEAIASESEFQIDEEEKKSWCAKRARVMYQGMLAAGYDMRKQRDGTVITEEEALANEAKEQEKYFVPYLIYCYFCEKDGFVMTEEAFVKEIERMAAERGDEPEELMKHTDIIFFRQQAYQKHTYDMLAVDAEKYLEV